MLYSDILDKVIYKETGPMTPGKKTRIYLTRKGTMGYLRVSSPARDPAWVVSFEKKPMNGSTVDLPTKAEVDWFLYCEQNQKYISLGDFQKLLPKHKWDWPKVGETWECTKDVIDCGTRFIKGRSYKCEQEGFLKDEMGGSSFHIKGIRDYTSHLRKEEPVPVVLPLDDVICWRYRPGNFLLCKGKHYKLRVDDRTGEIHTNSSSFFYDVEPSDRLVTPEELIKLKSWGHPHADVADSEPKPEIAVRAPGAVPELPYFTKGEYVYFKEAWGGQEMFLRFSDYFILGCSYLVGKSTDVITHLHVNGKVLGVFTKYLSRTRVHHSVSVNSDDLVPPPKLKLDFLEDLPPVSQFKAGDLVKVRSWLGEVQGLSYYLHFNTADTYIVDTVIGSAVMVKDCAGESVQVPAEYLTKVATSWTRLSLDQIPKPKPDADLDTLMRYHSLTGLMVQDKPVPSGVGLWEQMTTAPLRSDRLQALGQSIRTQNVMGSGFTVDPVIEEPDLFKKKSTSTFNTEIVKVKDLSEIKLFKPSKPKYT